VTRPTTSPGKPLDNARWERFAQLVVSGVPASRAHAEAGFKGTDKSHEANSSRLIRADRVAARIAELRAPALQRLAKGAEEAIDSATRIVREAARVAFGDIRDVVTWDGERVHLRDSADLTADQAATVKSIKTKRTTRTSKDGEEYVTEEREVQVWDKLSALNILKSRHPEFSEKIDARVLHGIVRVERGTRSLT